jgi:DNA-binding sugar fermentation-stimulating protein
VETADGIGIAGALVSADNGGTSATTDTAGYYSVTVPYGWSGTITPGKADYTFEPADLAYTDVRTDLAGENYTGSAAGYNVADHVFDILLSQIWDYNDQANPDDLKYVFYITLDTDATVESIDILTPAGNSLQIPADAHIVSGNTETWYSNDGGVAVWEYEAGFVDAAGLDGFGDGDYVITIYHDGGIQEQTIAAFSAAGTSDPLPQPTQEPILSNPVANSEIASPVIFTWETCSDAAASVISLELENLSTAQTQAFEFPVDSTSSSVVSLGNGTWQSELSFETSYQYNNADGVNVSMWKYSASTAGFNITQGDSGDSINATFDIDTDGFVYSDDTFNTSLPAYADGTYEANSGYSGGAINVNLGHGKTGGSTSGGWSRSFTLSEPSTVVASLRYRMLMADGYESDEYCEAILAIDGIRYGSDVNNSLVHLAGDGDGTIHDDTGWLSSEFEISLSPGEHTITVGAYNNNATSLQEWVEVFFDDIVVYAADTVPLPDAFIQEQGPDGIVSIEAENFDDNVTNGDHAWNLITLPVGFSGSGAMRAEPDVGTNNDTGYVANSPRLDFNVNFVKTGTHYIWIRGYETDGTDNSCHAGLDGQAIASSDRIGKFAGNQWVWSNTTRDNDSRATFTVNTEGVHTVNVWMREDGFRLDKVVLTTNPDYTPTSNGPAESQRPAPVDSEPPTPDPMTWTTQPNSTGTDSVSMTAATASDVSGVEYYFECVSGGGNDSDWQDSAAYSDTGLSPETEYSYRVKARDKSNQFNETGWSGIVSVITEAVPGVPDDTVTVVTAEYNLGNLELIVEAISNEQPDAVLSLEGYGQMTWNVDKGKYEYRVEGSVDPDGWVTVTSSLGGSTTVSVTYNGEVAVDVVTITKAEYNYGNLELRVEATSNEQPDAVLSLEGYGQMTWNVDKSKYEYRVEGSVDPDGWVTVTSSLGGSTTVSVTYNGEVAVDVVTITKAEYNLGNLELRVEATSTEQPDAVLSIEGYGQMTWNVDKSKYEYRVEGSVDPDDWVTVTSSLGDSTTVSVTYNGEVAVDVVTITKAEYNYGNLELRVEATSTEQPDAVLSLEGYGQMSWNADKNKYEYRVKGSVDPDGWITVTSSLGGSTTISVTYKGEVAVDVVTITKAEYKEIEQELRVEAMSTEQPDAVLTLEGYGQMSWNADKNKYEYKVKGSVDPDGWITVTSNLGGSKTSSMNYRDASEPIIIKKAEYKVEDRELRVEAYAVGSPDAVLTVDGYGKMVFNTEKSKYEYRIKPVGQPGNTITVISDSGNSASRSVVFD